MLTQRFYDAILFAGEVHAGQTYQDGSGVPYMAHLLAVSALVLDYGGSEDEAIAALLYDSVEQSVSLEVIRDDFGDGIAELVAGCSEGKGDWLDRKREFVAKLRQSDNKVKMVAAAVSLHNVRRLISAWREQGQAVWPHFGPSKMDVMWFYRGVCSAIGSDTSLGRDLRAEVAGLENVVEWPWIQNESA